MKERARWWNHNVHYHRRILDVVPQGARSALDVGTGDGLLATELRQALPEVIGLDLDHQVLERARKRDSCVHWVQGDVMSYPFAEASFDVVASIATVHHLPDLERTLRRLADLTAPGGVLAVIGVARSAGPSDALYDLAGLAQHHWYSRRYGLWEHTAPIEWPPRHTYAEARAAAADVLPGAIWARLPLWRYAVTWTRSHR